MTISQKIHVALNTNKFDAQVAAARPPIELFSIFVLEKGADDGRSASVDEIPVIDSIEMLDIEAIDVFSFPVASLPV